MGFGDVGYPLKKNTERWVFIYVEILEELFSKKNEGRFPDINEIENLLEQ